MERKESWNAIFHSNVGGDLVVDYPNIEASLVKVNGKEVQATRIKDNRIQLTTQKGDVITFENFPGRITRLTAQRKIQRLQNLISMLLKGRLIMSSIGKVEMKLVKILLSVNLQQTKLALSTVLLIQAMPILIPLRLC